VALKEYSDGFAACPRNQLALNRFLGDQAHGPSRLTFGRVAAHHGDNALLFRRRQ